MPVKHRVPDFMQRSVSPNSDRHTFRRRVRDLLGGTNLAFDAFDDGICILFSPVNRKPARAFRNQ